jgi:hypothetical protein
MTTASGKTLTHLRRGILWLLVVGMIGTGTELLLMEHTEDLWQLVPLILIAMSLPILGWCSRTGSRAGLRSLQVLSGSSVLSGVVGSLLHYRGNVEFELEMSPGLGGSDLFSAAMTGATPALAPGTMVLLGALGFLYTLGHPALAQHQRNEDL